MWPSVSYQAPGPQGVCGKQVVYDILADGLDASATARHSPHAKPYRIAGMYGKKPPRVFGEAVSSAPECRLRGTKAAQWLRVATGTRNPPRGHTSCPDL